MTDANSEAAQGNAAAVNANSFDGIMAKLDEKYDGWERSRSALYHILGYMFEAAATIDADPRLQAQLTAAVRKRPDVKASRRWNPDKKNTIEQLLAVRFGITGKDMGLKSNWLKTLRAAQAVEPAIPRTEAAFVEWITGVGGEEKARGQSVKTERITITDFSKAMESESPLAGIEFDLPEDVEPLDGLAVVLVREVDVPEGKPKRVKAVGIVTRKRTVEAVAAAAASTSESEFRALVRAAAREQEWTVRPGPKRAAVNPYDVPGPGNFHHEDDIKEYMAEKKINDETARVRRRSRQCTRAGHLLPHEIERKVKGKATLDEALGEDVTGDALSQDNETPSSPAAEAGSRVAVVEPAQQAEEVDWLAVLSAEEDAAAPR